MDIRIEEEGFGIGHFMVIELLGSLRAAFWVSDWKERKESKIWRICSESMGLQIYGIGKFSDQIFFFGEVLRLHIDVHGDVIDLFLMEREKDISIRHMNEREIKAYREGRLIEELRDSKLLLEDNGQKNPGLLGAIESPPWGLI